ncbi:MAG: cytochrome c oxidase subunit II [Roseiflexaceae bacterium]|nr:cytochrome c oxidase subunit II [Roseiflexaceae bacterium]
MPSRRPLRRALLTSGLLIAGAFILAACSADRPMSTLDVQGSHARNILDLLIPIFWAAVAVFVVVEGILLYTIFRFRSRNADTIPTQFHGNTTIEILWTIAPALIVLVIAVLTFRTQAINSRTSEDALRIVAVGQQWWFSFDYPEQGVTTANELYIPVGREVTVQLDARDVIHNFWIPKLAGKTYMIPGNTNYLTFNAETEGVYRGQCAEFCGQAHALMKFRVIAVQPEVFDQWVAAHKTIPAAPVAAAYTGTPPGKDTGYQWVPVMPAFPATVNGQTFSGDGTGGNAENGLAVYNGKGLCYTCHAIAGNEKAVGKVGPNLTYTGSRTMIAAGLIPNTTANMYAWLHAPGTIKPGNIMSTVIVPGLLTDQEIKDLTAYMESQTHDIPLPAER